MRRTRDPESRPQVTARPCMDHLSALPPPLGHDLFILLLTHLVCGSWSRTCPLLAPWTFDAGMALEWTLCPASAGLSDSQTVRSGQEFSCWPPPHLLIPTPFPRPSGSCAGVSQPAQRRGVMRAHRLVERRPTSSAQESTAYYDNH